MLVLVGAYTTPDPHAGRVRRMLGTVSGRRRQRPHGLHAFRLDPDNGRLARLVSTGGIADPSYVAIHPDGEHLYAVSERADGMAAAFRLDRRTGALEPLDRQSTCGSAPCHLTVHPTGRLLFVANYASGTVAVLPIREDGSLGPASDVVRHVGSSIHPTRQKVPHPHSVAIDPSGRFALVADLGIDRVAVYRIDLKAGKLSPADPPSVAVPPGQGPRHIVFDPGGRSVFLVAELGCTLTSFGWDPALGVLEARASHSTLPRDALGPSTAADVVVHPNGHLVFASNRGHDSIAVFRDAHSGDLASPEFFASGGRWPRGLAVDPAGRFLLAANGKSGDLVVFRIDPDSGGLTASGRYPLPGCACVRILDDAPVHR